MPSYDPNRITQLEERLAVTPAGAEPQLSELEMLADLYLHADSYLPALETIERLLSLPAARTLSPTRRAALESKVIACRIAQGQSQAALAHCREVLQGEADIDSPAIRAKLHVQCGDALFYLSRFGEAREQAETAVRIADSAGDFALSAVGTNQLGRIAYREGDLPGAREHYEHALALFRRLGDTNMCGVLRNNLGLVHKNLCEWDAAIANFRAALEHYREAGRFAMTGPPHLHLGIVYQKTGDWERADESYRAAEQVFLQSGDQHHLAHVAIGLGNVARLKRQFVPAEELFLTALERARGNSAAREEVLALEFLGENDFDRGHATRALERYAEALALAQRVAPEGDLVVELERRRAEALAALDRFEEAARACDRARDLARRTEDRFEYAVCHRVAGEIAWASGHRTEAIEAWNMAVALLGDCRERLELGRVHLSLSRAASDSRESRRHVYRAIALLGELSGPWWMEQAEAELQRLVALPVPNVSELVPARPASLLGKRHRAPSLVACSPEMQRVESLARRAAATELSVLVTGETGTGKELVARTIHALSPRAPRPFLAVNCGALRADLALSQLFGHRKGAFTGAHAEGMGLVEAAHGGTLFLDEVGELPHDVQVTLLRFLETGEYLRLGETQVRRADVRVIAATNRELRGSDGERVFRRDLLFRLNEIEIRLPSLRERSEDIVPLARHFLSFYGGIEGPRLSHEAEGVLAACGWPGNVRELENVMKRVAALYAGEELVGTDAIMPFLAREEEAPLNGAASPGRERERILAAHREAHGNKSRVAEILGISRKTLYARLKRLGLELPHA